MFPLNFSNLKHVLCLGAHPDDIEIGCGGTLLTLMQANRELKIHWIIFSATETRRREAETSFNIWCPTQTASRLEIHSFTDSYFPWEGREIKKTMQNLSAELSPDLIFTTRRADKHQDHRVLSELTWNAFRNHLILEYEIPKYDADLGNPNFYFPLTQEIAGEKVGRLMSSFHSQHSKAWYRPATFESLMRIRGIECNSTSGFAESFYAEKVCLRAGS